jgi:hypothetical protein
MEMRRGDGRQACRYTVGSVGSSQQGSGCGIDAKASRRSLCARSLRARRNWAASPPQKTAGQSGMLASVRASRLTPHASPILVLHAGYCRGYTPPADHATEVQQRKGERISSTDPPKPLRVRWRQRRRRFSGAGCRRGIRLIGSA